MSQISNSIRPETHKCPFHPDSGGIPLSDIPSIVRVNDRVRMQVALGQLTRGINQMVELDEARGEALTFLAVVTAATLELGGSRDMHRVQLEAARKFDDLTTVEGIAQSVAQFVERVAPQLFRPDREPNADLMDKAVSLINLHYSRKLADFEVARHLGLSTSHFRYLFRQVTGQPFHKYLLTLRLEKAHAMIVQETMSVTEVAQAVGFTGLSHFSRAFSDRFSVRPSQMRHTGSDQA